MLGQGQDADISKHPACNTTGHTRCCVAPKPDAFPHRLLDGLARSDPPVFLCHFYNIYFAHTAGGRLIGAKVAQMILDSKDLAFYKVSPGSSCDTVWSATSCAARVASAPWWVVLPCHHLQPQPSACMPGESHMAPERARHPLLRGPARMCVRVTAPDGRLLLQYEGDFKEKLNAVREQLNAVAEGWTREDKDRCLQETEKSFAYSGGLLRTITSSD